MGPVPKITWSQTVSIKISEKDIKDVNRLAKKFKEE